MGRICKNAYQFFICLSFFSLLSSGCNAGRLSTHVDSNSTALTTKYARTVSDAMRNPTLTEQVFALFFASMLASTAADLINDDRICANNLRAAFLNRDAVVKCLYAISWFCLYATMDRALVLSLNVAHESMPVLSAIPHMRFMPHVLCICAGFFHLGYVFSEKLRKRPRNVTLSSPIVRTESLEQRIADKFKISALPERPA